MSVRTYIERHRKDGGASGCCDAHQSPYVLIGPSMHSENCHDGERLRQFTAQQEPEI